MQIQYTVAVSMSNTPKPHLLKEQHKTNSMLCEYFEFVRGVGLREMGHEKGCCSHKIKVQGCSTYQNGKKTINKGRVLSNNYR